ncbi:MAG: hypothetical protein AAF206_07310 [Bacteroidota bacterium]
MRYSLILLFSILLAASACKSGDDLYLYEVDELQVNQSGVDKNNLKSELEFLSLAYSDLFGETVSDDILNSMMFAYQSLGDKALIADILIRNMLNAPEADVPSDQEMRANPDAFITAVYKKFYVREPNEYERWYFNNLIQTDPNISPETIFYAFLTSDEYRFY